MYVTMSEQMTKERRVTVLIFKRMTPYLLYTTLTYHKTGLLSLSMTWNPRLRMH